MVELRWAVPAETTTKAPRLQYRQLPSVVSFGGPGWSEWQDVPWVVVPEAPQPAPTVLSALGVPVTSNDQQENGNG